MPYINIKMTHEDGGASVEQKEALIKGMTEVFDKVIGRGAKTAVVIIDEVSTHNYGMGGKTINNIREEQKT
ncbi:MAG: tautomerase [Arcobacter sp.]|nr:MAG: tautomerase [Arcobacter sp.]